MDGLTERLYSPEIAFKGRLLTIEKWMAELPNGESATREIVRHVGASAVLPIDCEGNVYLVRQYRAPLGRITLEIPAGKLNFKGEDRLVAAKRELSEETGFSARDWLPLAEIATTPGFSDEIIGLYLASGLERGEMHTDDDEFINVVSMPYRRLLEMVESGEIEDSKTICAVLMAKRHLGE